MNFNNKVNVVKILNLDFLFRKNVARVISDIIICSNLMANSAVQCYRTMLHVIHIYFPIIICLGKVGIS